MMVDGRQPSLTFENNPELTVVIPAYYEEGNLHQLYAELMRVLPLLNMVWEIIIVDDGSTDRTWEEIQALHRQNAAVKGIRFSRNFGHQYALLAGLYQAGGDVVVTMDADLQHPPEVIPQLVDAWRQGNKIVHTIRLDSENLSFFKKTTSKFFYKVFSFLSGVKLESGMADFRLLDRQVVENILQFREEGLFLRGLVQWVGYPSATVEFQCRDRFSGMSKYTLKKMLKFAFSGITAFSIVPLRISIFVGILTGILAFGEMLFAIFVRLFTDAAVPGWTSAVGVLSLLFGILFVLLGVVGEYIGQILLEVRSRPRFLVSDGLGVANTAMDQIRFIPTQSTNLEEMLQQDLSVFDAHIRSKSFVSSDT